MIQSMIESMTESLTLKFKIILIFFILIVVTSIGGYWYLTKMNVVSGNLNINKTKPIDKLCNYNVYSDFYYRINNYKNNTSYAELTPMRTTICYDLKANKVELQNRVDAQSNIILDDTNGNNIEKKISLLENFRKSYSEIVATQDKDYFQKSYETAKKTLDSLYGIDTVSVEAVDPQKNYYTKLNNLPIENMVVEHFNLKHISLSPNQMIKTDKWKPNIIEWNFGEKDRIYLQYLKKYSNHDLDEFINDTYATSDKTIIRLTKFNRNTLSKMFLIFDDDQKKIKTLFMDNNGYIYILVMQVSNKKAFESYFNDYMRIAYGIYFIEKDGLDTSYIQEQKRAISYYKQYHKLSKELIKSYKVLEDYKCVNVLENYKETKNITQKMRTLNKEINLMENLKFDKRYAKFKQLNGDYPCNVICDTIKKDIQNIELLTEGIQEFKPLTALFSDKYQQGANELRKKCRGNIECIQRLKNKDWENN